MRLVKRGSSYSIVYEEGGRQVWIATGLSDRALAEERIVRERKALALCRANPYAATENRDLKIIPAVKGFMKRKRQLTDKQQKSMRRRLLVMTYEILAGKLVRRQVRLRFLKKVIKPFLIGKRMLDINAVIVDTWVEKQLDNGRGRLATRAHPTPQLHRNSAC